jgi:hypothetical protein
MNKANSIKNAPNIKKLYAPIASSIIGNKNDTKVLEPQFTNTATEVAFPLASEPNNSL